MRLALPRPGLASGLVGPRTSRPRPSIYLSYAAWVWAEVSRIAVDGGRLGLASRVGSRRRETGGVGDGGAADRTGCGRQRGRVPSRLPARSPRPAVLPLGQRGSWLVARPVRQTAEGPGPGRDARGARGRGRRRAASRGATPPRSSRSRHSATRRGRSKNPSQADCSIASFGARRRRYRWTSVAPTSRSRPLHVVVATPERSCCSRTRIPAGDCSRRPRPTPSRRRASYAAICRPRCVPSAS